MPERTVYVNGKIVPESEAKLSIFDSSFQYGYSVMEATRTYNHKPFKLRRHLERLFRSLKVSRIKPPVSMEEMELLTINLLDANLRQLPKATDTQIMIFVSGGTLKYYRQDSSNGLSTLVIYCWPLEYFFAKFYETGGHIILPSVRQVASQVLDPKIKHRSRMYMVLGMTEASLIDPESFVIFQDMNGNLAEGPGWNFFLVKDGKLFTSKRENILEGITRSTVLEISEKLGIPAYEENLQPYDLYTSDEAFLTASSFAILPMTRVNHMQVGDGQVGPITRKLLLAWSELVGVDFVNQAISHARQLDD